MRIHILILLHLISFQLFAVTNSVFDEDPAHSASVTLQVNFKTTGGDFSTGYCSGTIISPRLIITAAHCFITEKDESVNDIVVLAKKPKVIRRNGVERVLYPVIFTVKSQTYFTTSKIKALLAKKSKSIPPAHDIAIIKTDEEMPLKEFNIAEIPMATPTEFNSAITNIKRQAFVVEGLNPFEHEGDRKYAYFYDLLFKGVTFNSNEPIFQTSNQTAMLQPADSGAALYTNLNQMWQIIGIGKGVMKQLFKISSIFAPIHPNICELLTHPNLHQSDLPIKNPCP